MYFLWQFEDTLNAFVRLTVELDFIYQLSDQQSTEDTLTIVSFYSSEAKGYLAPLLKKAERSKRLLLDSLTDSLLGEQA
ncbi:unnamed protein product [Sphagnum balticum]